MKKVILLLMALACFVSEANAYDRDTYVQGYTRRDGTYVQGYHRTAPDNNVYNNYSTRGNVNPYTGQAGTVNPTPSFGNSYQQPNYGYGYGKR